MAVFFLLQRCLGKSQTVRPSVSRRVFMAGSLSQFSAVPSLSIPSSLPTLTLPELPSLPMKFSPLLFRLYKHSPSITRYLRAIYSLRTSSLKGLAVHYCPSATDHRGRLYPCQVGAAKLPKTLRLLLFGSDHHEIDLVGSHYQIFQRFHALSSADPLPTVQQLRRLFNRRHG